MRASARFVSLVSWVSRCDARPDWSSATKATGETDLHPAPACISTLGMTTRTETDASGPPHPAAGKYVVAAQSRSVDGGAANDVRAS